MIEDPRSVKIPLSISGSYMGDSVFTFIQAWLLVKLEYLLHQIICCIQIICFIGLFVAFRLFYFD